MHADFGSTGPNLWSAQAFHPFPFTRRHPLARVSFSQYTNLDKSRSYPCRLLYIQYRFERPLSGPCKFGKYKNIQQTLNSKSAKQCSSITAAINERATSLTGNFFTAPFSSLVSRAVGRIVQSPSFAKLFRNLHTHSARLVLSAENLHKHVPKLDHK